MESLRNILPNDIIKYVINKYYLFYHSKKRINLKEFFKNKNISMHKIAYSNNEIYMHIRDNDRGRITIILDVIYNLSTNKLTFINDILSKYRYSDVIANDNYINCHTDNCIHAYNMHNTNFSTLLLNLMPSKDFIKLPHKYEYRQCFFDSNLYVLSTDMWQICVKKMDTSKKFSLEKKINTGKYNGESFPHIYISENYIYLCIIFYTEDRSNIVVFSRNTYEKIKDYNIKQYEFIVIYKDFLFANERECVHIFNALTGERIYKLSLKFYISKFYVNNNTLIIGNKYHKFVKLFFLNLL